eukprot:SAG31_NODE_1149_length_9659_cov_4.862238_3_plen_64_part_00
MCRVGQRGACAVRVASIACIAHATLRMTAQAEMQAVAYGERPGWTNATQAGGSFDEVPDGNTQ